MRTWHLYVVETALCCEWYNYKKLPKVHFVNVTNWQRLAKKTVV